jgi:hypothetical protein
MNIKKIHSNLNNLNIFTKNFNSSNVKLVFNKIKFPKVGSNVIVHILVEPSFLALEPFLTYTLIGSWCKLMSKIFLITFFEMLFLKNYGLLENLWWALSFLPSCFIVFIFSLLLAWGTWKRGHHYWIIFKHEVGWPFSRSFICFGPLLNTFRNH